MDFRGNVGISGSEDGTEAETHSEPTIDLGDDEEFFRQQFRRIGDGG